jgi:uncharacterized membrane protein
MSSLSSTEEKRAVSIAQGPWALTFVMISQNRADAKRQVIADAHWKTVQEEETENQELLELSRQILQLTKEVHALTAEREGQSVESAAEQTARPIRRVRSSAARA